jgi:hypothetical protein
LANNVPELAITPLKVNEAPSSTTTAPEMAAPLITLSVPLSASIAAPVPEVFSTPPKMVAPLSWTSAPLPSASINRSRIPEPRLC